MKLKQTAGSTSLPRDDDSAPIQILSPQGAGTVHVTATEGTSTAAAFVAGAAVVRIAATGAVWLAFGPSGVDAGQGQADTFLFPAGAEFFFLRDTDYTDIAARSVSGAGTVLVTATVME